ncbi:hypothetical protein [Fibrella aquatica]|uniref:hypothetical protein n=1 Tax=Fibrella aquatica TaxID=3242487 RepID=UPI00351F9F04
MQDGIKKRLTQQIHLMEDYIYDLRLRMVRNPELMEECERMIEQQEWKLLQLYDTLEMFD